jgi:hypothetical protein
MYYSGTQSKNNFNVTGGSFGGSNPASLKGKLMSLEVSAKINKQTQNINN